MKRLLIFLILVLVCSCSFGAKPSVIATLSEANTTNSGWLFPLGNYCYMTSYGSDYLHVFNIKQPKNPYLVASITDPNMDGPEGVWAVGDYLYVTCTESDAFIVFDISDPTNPTEVATIVDAVNLEGAEGVDISGNYAFVCCYYGDTYTIVDITDPLNPSVKSSVAVDEEPLDSEISGDYAFVACNASNTLVSVDISDLDNPAVDDTLSIVDVHTLAVSGDYALVAGMSGRLASIDISDPNSMVQLDLFWTNLGTLYRFKHVRIDGNLAYANSTASADTFTVFDISDMTDLKAIDYIKTGGAELDGADGLEIRGNYAYISCWTSGNFTIVSLKGSKSYRNRYNGGSHRSRYQF